MKKDDIKTKTSIYISLLLRHKPWLAGLTIDEHGWADTKELIGAVKKKYPMNMEILEDIVKTDQKQRYSLNEDHTKIRANQGHSIPVDVELEELDPPEFLYHGTARKSVPSIQAEGLKHMKRLYVHLSSDYETAIKTGQRHGVPVVFLVHASEMRKDGYAFYLSKNHVWLAENVPAQYLELLS